MRARCREWLTRPGEKGNFGGDARRVSGVWERSKKSSCSRCRAATLHGSGRPPRSKIRIASTNHKRLAAKDIQAAALQ